MKVRLTTEIEIDIETCAKWFAGLDDDSQARFITAVAKEASTWGPGKANTQWFLVGSHIRHCECSTYEAKQFVTELHNGFENGLH